MNAETYDSFGQSSSGTSSLHPSDAIKMQDLVSAIETSIQIESQMNIIKSMNQKCFERCIYKPSSSSLGNGERQCIAKCMDRFQDGLKVVNQTIMQRSKAEAESMHHSAGLQ
ncbi:hypothetical protein ACHWQZ_G006261 [Mnemiopsis leidyi]